MKKILLISIILLPFLSLFGQTNEARIESILQKMTLEEKLDFIGGINIFDVRGFEKYGIPLMKTADSPFGVRRENRANVMVGGIALAATWNPNLAQETGLQIGRDARSRGVHYSLGPGVNIYRSPLNGRNFEYFGEDPFLGSRLVVPFIKGLQSQGVSATVKHFIGNNSEYWRHRSDSIIDERTMREIYLPIFEAAVKDAKTGAVMSSYNLVNGKYMSANSEIATGILKGDWNFEGVYMSDWGATYETIGAVNGGVDLEMPLGQFMNRQTILPLIKEGKVKESTIDDKVRRLLRTAIRFGWLDRPQEDASIPKLNQAGKKAALQTARESIVLLKNANNLLPLAKSKLKNIAVIGPNGFNTPALGGGSATIYPFQNVDFLSGISDKFGTNANVTFARGLNKYNNYADLTRFDAGVKAEFYDNLELSGTPVKTENQPSINLGKLIETNSFGNSAEFEAVTVGEMLPSLSVFAGPKPMSARWTGNFTPKSAGDYEIFVQQTGFGDSNYRLYVDGKLVRDCWAITKAATDLVTLPFDTKPHQIVLEFKAKGGLSQHFIRLGIVKKGNWVEQNALELAKKADVVIVPVGFNASTETENFDRTFALPPGQNELIQQLAAVNKNVIVVINSGGGVEMSPWIDKVSGVLQAWYLGQEGGTALAEILSGDTNPSGRLPITIERNAEDNPTFNNYYPTPNTNKIGYKEGIFVGYRGYEKYNVKPLFPFGFGLSYTNFQYRNLSVKPLTDGRFEVSFDVKNIGSREGGEVAQVYVGSKKDAKVSRPVKELKGFEKVFLKAGETKKVSVILDKRAFSYFDVNSKKWLAEAGDYEILVGSSAAEIVLKGKANLKSDLISER
jgi:beta-glucosidase